MNIYSKKFIKVILMLLGVTFWVISSQISYAENTPGLSSELISAAKNCNVNSIKDFFELNEDFDINSTDEKDSTLLMFASANGCKEVVEFLLDKNIDVRKKNKFGRTAFSYAMAKKDYNIAKLLAKKKFSNNEKIQQGSDKLEDLASNIKSQGVIFDSIAKYTEKYPEAKSLFDEFLRINKSGMCYGLTMVWSEDHLKNTGTNKSQFNDMLHRIGTWVWDQENKFNNEELSKIKKFTDKILEYQMYQLYQDNICYFVKNNYLKSFCNEKDSIKSISTKERLKELLNNVNYGELTFIVIEVEFEGKKVGGHVTGLFRDKDYYYYYDSNNLGGEIKETTLEKIADYIIDSNKRVNQDSIGLMTFTTVNFEFDEKKPDTYLYPRVPRLLLKESFLDLKELNILSYLDKMGEHKYSDSDSKANNGIALSVAIKKDHKEVLKKFLDDGIDPNEIIYGVRIPITEAIMEDRADMVEILLNYKANPNGRRDCSDCVPLLSALNPPDFLKQPNIDIIKILLKYGANPNEGDKYDIPLIVALEKGYADIVKMFLDNKADPNIKRRNGDSALMIALKNNYGDTIIDSFLGHGANPNITDEYGNTALIETLYNKYPHKAELVRKLLNVGADPNKINKFGNSALTIAIENNDTATIDVLLSSKDIDTNNANSKGITALTKALEKNRIDIIKKLLDKKADPNKGNVDFFKDYSPLHYAVIYNYCDAADMLVAHGAKINKEMEASLKYSNCESLKNKYIQKDKDEL